MVLLVVVEGITDGIVVVRVVAEFGGLVDVAEAVPTTGEMVVIAIVVGPVVVMVAVDFGEVVGVVVKVVLKEVLVLD